MEDFVILKNNDINDNLLEKLLIFDRMIFPVNENYAFPDDYLKNLYNKSKDGLFILLLNNEIIGYINCIFITEDVKEQYLKDKNYLNLKNVGFKIGNNNMYFYTACLKKEYRDTLVIKKLMQSFTLYLEEEKSKGKIISSCISDAITSDGIKFLLKMGMEPLDISKNGLGIYYSKDCLNEYINNMNKAKL